jgi:uncharacterized RDD family membrane protein YckC
MKYQEWFYRDAEKSVGPFNLSRLNQLHAAGIITNETLIRRNDSREWIEFSDLNENEESLESQNKESDSLGENRHRVESSTLELGIENGQRIEPTFSDASHGDLPETNHPLNLTDNQSDQGNQINGWFSTPVTPWRRYGARVLDISINGSIGAFLLGLGWYAIAPMSAEAFFSSLNPVVDILLTVFLSIIISGILIGFSGSSIGKWVFGIRVTMDNGSPMGIINGLLRDVNVWIKGLALGIPFISVVTLFMSYRRLNNKGFTSWDESEGYVVTHRPNSWMQYFLNAFGIILIVIIQVLLRLVD